MSSPDDLPPSKKLKLSRRDPVVIDHIAFPHIIDGILTNVDSWLPMRATCKACYERVNRERYKNLVITADAPAPGPTTGGNHAGPPLVFSVSGPNFRLPEFIPRCYDALRREDPIDFKTDRFLALLRRYIVTLEIPLPASGFYHLEWFRREIGNHILTIRLFSDLRLAARSTAGTAYGPNVYVSFLAHKIVLLPVRHRSATRIDVQPYPIRFDRIQFGKMVSHVVYSTQSKGMVTHIPVVADRHMNVREQVYIFTECYGRFAENVSEVRPH